jgi:hypothetical protein
LAQCAICGRALRDRKSIGLGMGPKCRKKSEAEFVRELQEQGLDGKVLAGGRGVQIGWVGKEKTS